MIHHHLNCQNRTFFNGDNLDVMRGINSQSIDLIATDPPFNKNRDFHATPDSLAKGASFQDRWSWEKDVHQDWVDQLHDDHPMLMEAIESAKHAHSEGMGAYMCFMSVRLLEMHRVLKPKGSIYLHCDPTASHYLKAVMDAIFGHKNFKNEIIWCYSTSGRPKRFFAKKHDVILFYSKTNQLFWSNYKIPVSEKYLNSHYKQRDSAGKRCRIRIDHGKKRFYYPEDGVICNDWWDDIPYLNSQAKERTGYPTQKPLSLYQRIINASTRKDDIVLDPFAGCATTCMAAEALERHWIGIDIWKDAHLILTKRLQQNYDACPIYVRTDIPTRTDHGQTAGPYLKVKDSIPEPPGIKMSRADIRKILLSQQGLKCQGCDRKFDNAKYLELDHNTPRSDGGINHISNRILLCGPCNRTKSNIYTLSGLRRINQQTGFMKA